MKIAIGSDHAGYGYKQVILDQLKKLGHETIDCGPNSNASVDYPDFIHPVAKSVSEGDSDYGIIICGSGNGAAITANKYQNIRAALCWNRELAQLARLHNNANILALPARYVSVYQAMNMVEDFLSTDFEGGRHLTRVNKIALK